MLCKAKITEDGMVYFPRSSAVMLPFGKGDRVEWEWDEDFEELRFKWGNGEKVIVDPYRKTKWLKAFRELGRYSSRAWVPVDVYESEVVVHCGGRFDWTPRVFEVYDLGFLRMPNGLKKALEVYAKKHKRTKSSVLREALVRFFEDKRVRFLNGKV